MSGRVNHADRSCGRHSRSVTIRFMQSENRGNTLIPGTKPDKQNDFLYVETEVGETSLSHLRAMTRVYRRELKTGALRAPSSGMLGTTSWLLQTPEGGRFFGLSVSGDRTGWLAALRHCARQEGRATGQIIGYTRIPARFALDDGQSFSLEECQCKKIAAE